MFCQLGPPCVSSDENCLEELTEVDSVLHVQSVVDRNKGDADILSFELLNV